MIKTRGWKFGLSLGIGAGVVLVCGVAFAGYESGEVAKEDWVARYNGLANNEDRANDLVVDSQGNIYVTGNSFIDDFHGESATIKYDTSGNELWVAHHAGSSSNALTFDLLGNIYVTGTTFDGVTRNDYITIKYDTNGNQLWDATYNSSGNGDDIAKSIAVDPQGNVYVAGNSNNGNAGPYDFVIVKYDTNGNQLWITRYNGPGNNNDEVNALAVDPEGNVYVAGYSVGIGTDRDYTTIKYDTNGNRLWVARYHGGYTGDSVEDIAVDSQGNVYVTGYSHGGLVTYSDYATIKYDLNGNQLWVARYNGSQSKDDRAYAIAVDIFGNVYVAGYTNGYGYEDYATIKYDANGSRLWVTTYNGLGSGRDEAYNLDLDPQGNVYVTGYSYSQKTNYDYVTVKYGTNGNELWVARYIHLGYDRANPMAVDAQGNVYISGYSASDGLFSDYVTIKYLQLPTVSADLQEYDDVLHRGEDLQYQLTLTNNSDRDQIVNYWSQVKDGNGSLREAVLPTPVTLGPNEIYTTEYSHAIPGKSPKGQYEYIGNVGEDVDHLWDEDTFTFNIVPPGIFDLNLGEGAR